MFHFTCDVCGLHREMRYIPRVYLLGQERFVPMEQRHFWCASCDDISVCESLVRPRVTLEMFRDQLQRYRDMRDNPPSDLAALSNHERYDVEHAPEMIRELEQTERDWEEWRARRSAPVRCLKCARR